MNINFTKISFIIISIVIFYEAFIEFRCIFNPLKNIWYISNHPKTGFPKWGRLVGEDNLGKLAKNCMKLTKSAFLGQNSGGGHGGAQANFLGSRGDPPSPPH